MATYLTIEDATNYGVSLQEARRLTDEERTRYKEEYRDRIFIGLSDKIELPHISWEDMPKRDHDGSFNGCDNRAWIITQDEWDRYISIEASRAVEEIAKARVKELTDLRAKLSKIDAQGKLYTADEACAKARWYRNTYCEGGEGYVPHYYTVEERQHIVSEIAKLEIKLGVTSAAEQQPVQDAISSAQVTETTGATEAAESASASVSEPSSVDISDADCILKPERWPEDGIVDITIDGKRVKFAYGYHTGFIDLMHDHGCTFISRKWGKDITDRTPSAEDIAAAIGAHLVREHFTVRFPSADIRDKAISGEYEVEHTRWVLAAKDGSLLLSWAGWDDKLYKAARRINGSRWLKPHVSVPADMWKKVLNFADTYDFRIVPAAQSIIDRQKATLDKAITATPEEPRRVEK